MSQRKPTRHDRDCQLVIDYIISRGPQKKRDLPALRAFERIMRRAKRATQFAHRHSWLEERDRALHVEEYGFPRTRVYCGRLKKDVDYVPLYEVDSFKDEQWCKRCVARIKKEETLP